MTKTVSINNMTIGEANKLYAKGIVPEKDWQNLTKKLFDFSKRNDYDLVFLASETPQTTFHPLTRPLTLKDARERYKQERETAINPGFKEIIEIAGDHNRFCNYEDNYYFKKRDLPDYLFHDSTLYGVKNKKKIHEIEVTDFINFLYFADKVIDNCGWHTPNIIKKIWFGLRKKEINDIKDPNPIVIVTNPEKDGLVDVFKKDLRNQLVNFNKGLRIIQYGAETVENLRDFYFDEEIKDFDYVLAHFTNPKAEYSGVFTKDISIICNFAGVDDLLGLENEIKGKFVRGFKGESEYRGASNDFERLRYPEKWEKKMAKYRKMGLIKSTQ